jgi:hypothetical protein
MQHELALAQATRSGEPYVTVEFTRNAKGETQISTKVSAPAGTDGEKLRELAIIVQREAEAVYDTATARYPSTNGAA